MEGVVFVSLTLPRLPTDKQNQMETRPQLASETPDPRVQDFRWLFVLVPFRQLEFPLNLSPSSFSFHGELRTASPAWETPLLPAPAPLLDRDGGSSRST